MMTEIETVNDLTQARLNALFDLKEWQKLLIHFDLAPDSFAFIPVIVPDSSWAELCEKALADFLRTAEKKKLQVISLKKPEQLKNLANKLFNLKPNKNIGAIWITAPIPFKKEELEEWQAAWREGIARLNQYRNPFREKFDVPVLLVGAEWIKEITRNMAPDLWSVLTILVRIEPPAISISELQKIETAAASQQFEGWRGVDPYFALQEAERLRGKKGQEIGLARLLYRVANGFFARAKYREALQSSNEAAEIIEKLLNNSREKDKNEIELFYADVLNTKGIALDSLGRLDEAIEEYDKAIETYEKLVADGRTELSNNLAAAYMNKGVALDNLGRLDEAIEEYDKAIETYEKLVADGRSELSNNLAAAYMNKGVSLRGLGRLDEAIEEYDKAIETYEKLVEAKRSELSSDLALAYMNKGSAFIDLERNADAITEYDYAIEIYERLINFEQRVELSNDLAKTFWGKGIALKNLGEPNEAVRIYDEAVDIWFECLKRKEFFVLPNLFTVFYLRSDVLIALEDWKQTAENLKHAYEIREGIFTYKDISDYFKDKVQSYWEKIIRSISKVSLENREEIYKNAGETGDIIQQYVEDFGENQQDSTK